MRKLREPLYQARMHQLRAQSLIRCIRCSPDQFFPNAAKNGKSVGLFRSQIAERACPGGDALTAFVPHFAFGKKYPGAATGHAAFGNEKGAARQRQKADIEVECDSRVHRNARRYETSCRAQGRIEQRCINTPMGNAPRVVVFFTQFHFKAGAPRFKSRHAKTQEVFEGVSVV